MPTRLISVRHSFGGGLATDFGSVAEGSPDRAGSVTIPFLLAAENSVYSLNGSPVMMGGTTKLNSTALESGASVRGLFDYWAQGTSGSATQHRIIHVGTKIKSDNADGVFTDILTGVSALSIPYYATFDDLCIIMSDLEVPKSFDGTTTPAPNIAGAPNGSFGVTHKTRFWMAGVDALPSRLYYSVLLNPLDWAGAGSGFIDIDPDDGDRITAMISHKNELWVFKGPYKGSIHRIPGSSPTGSDAFARIPFIEGIGCVGAHAIFRYHDDVGFVWSDGSVHSLKATAAYGDFNAMSLSFPINGYMKGNGNASAFSKIWCAGSVGREGVRMGIPIASSTTINQVLWMDHRFDPVRWSFQPQLGSLCQCVARVFDTGGSGFHEFMAGGNDGFVRKLDRPESSIDGSTAISWQAGTPRMSYGDPIRRKTIYAVAVGAEARGNYDLTFCWQRDQQVEQSIDIALVAGGDVLAPAPSGSSPFILGDGAGSGSVLAGPGVVDRFAPLEDGGEFSSISYCFRHSGVGEPIEISPFTVQLELGAESLEND